MSCTNYMVIKILPSPGVGGGGLPYETDGEAHHLI